MAHLANSRISPIIYCPGVRVIFFHSPAQQAAAQASEEKWGKSGQFKRPIVTEITPAQTFYRAEEYHQQYLGKRGLAHCHI